MIDPEKVIAPMNVPRKSSMRLPMGIDDSRSNESGSLTTAQAMSTAAIPTSECMAATSSGIWVICTRLATMRPMAPPSAIMPRAMSMRRVMVNVVPTAIAMPMMPKRLPRRAEPGCDSPLSARMKSTLAIRYEIAVWLADIALLLPLRFLLLEHVEHALTDHESAERVDGRESDRDRTKDGPKAQGAWP